MFALTPERPEFRILCPKSSETKSPEPGSTGIFKLQTAQGRTGQSGGRFRVTVPEQRRIRLGLAGPFLPSKVAIFREQQLQTECELSRFPSLSPLAHYRPEPSLLDGAPSRQCRACVILPARNEARNLPAALNALAGSVDLTGQRLLPHAFEVLLLLNNCTDDSPAVVRRWQAAHPEIALHAFERTLPAAAAHVGTARRWLMDTAWRRLERHRGLPAAILSTDADTVVSSDWIAQNLAAIEGGADAVGGAIHFTSEELASLPEGARRALRWDARYQSLVAELEHWLDPQPGDPWPRHLQHFGASLACTPEAYARAGGMPAIDSLEDVAFVDALRRIDARLRHAPEVAVYSSARLDGRAGMGLSNQLRQWHQMSREGGEHRVPSCAWLAHRFGTLRRLREACTDRNLLACFPCSPRWKARLRAVGRERFPVGRFLAELDCDSLIEASFRGARFGEIAQVCDDIQDTLEHLRCTAAERVRQPAAAPDRRFTLAEAASGD